MSDFHGYRREDGQIGVRNHLLLLPTSVSASVIAVEIADNVGPPAVATPHQMGLSQSSPARKQTERTLAGIGSNPNVGGVLIVELGIESIDADELADTIANSGKPVEVLTVHDAGGTIGAIDSGTELASSLLAELERSEREPADAGELILGVECGGSDATSGIAANPAVGLAGDRLVEAGGTVCFSETPEFIGAEHILADRCATEEVASQLLDRVQRRESMADLMGVDMRGAQPTPGNQDGGLTTIEEKSLGAIAKGGTTPIREIVDYAEALPARGGLVLMDTPGYDVESVVGKVAGGAQLIAFTTGRGSTTGNPIAPVIKVTGNPQTWRRMSNNMDVNAASLFDGESLESIGERVYEQLLTVANGQRTESEHRGLTEFAINEINPHELGTVREAQ